MEHFYVITNPSKDKGLKYASFIREYLIKRGKTCIVDGGSEGRETEGYTDSGRVPGEIDCVIVLGGTERCFRPQQIWETGKSRFWGSILELLDFWQR